MVLLPFPEAVIRIQQNDERVNTFANGGITDTYLTETGEEVPSLAKFLNDLTTGSAPEFLPAEVAARIAADAVLTARLNAEASLHTYYLTITGTEDLLVGTSTPTLPALTNGLQVAFIAPFDSIAGMKLNTKDIVYPDAIPIVNASFFAGSLVKAMLVDDKWRLTESTMSGNRPVGWFSASGLYGTDPVEVLPSAPNLDTFYIFNNDKDESVAIETGGDDPEFDALGIEIGPKDFWSSKGMETPVRLKTTRGDVPLTIKFSTFDFKNPKFESDFTKLLARESTTLTQDWKDISRTLYVSMGNILRKLRIFMPMMGPDANFALQNWAMNTKAVAFNAPALDPVLGFTFDGAANHKYLNTMVDRGDLSESDIFVGIETSETTATTNTLGCAISNQTNYIGPRQSTGTKTRSSSPTSQTFDPASSNKGGFNAISRLQADQYKVYVGSEVHTHTQVALAGAPSFPFLIGTDAAAITGAAVAGAHYTGHLRYAVMGHGLTPAEIAITRAAIAQHISDAASI